MLLRFQDSTEPRLDVYLAQNVPGLSRTAAQRLVEEGHVTVNGARERVSYKLQEGDEISVQVPEPKPTEVRAQDIPLEILYQDSELAVVEKPAGLVVHPAVGHADGTLVNALLHHVGDLSGVGGELRPGIVHRIDRQTSGILLVTKTDRAHLALSQQFKEHSITRRYQGLAWGKLPPQGEWNGPIGRDPKERKRMAIVEEGRRALTRYRSEKHFGSALTLFEAELFTGRTHQVRVHFASAGFPLVGDATYTNAHRRAKLAREAGLKAVRRHGAPSLPAIEELEARNRQFLHAAHLGFTHPVTGARLEFHSKLPPDLAALMVSLAAWDN